MHSFRVYKKIETNKALKHCKEQNRENKQSKNNLLKLNEPAGKTKLDCVNLLFNALKLYLYGSLLY